MAGDWVKMRSNLWDDPRVSAVCDEMECGEAAVVGGLFRLWTIADQHSEDGQLPAMTAAALDRKCGLPGFAKALQVVGWLMVASEGLQVPRFGEHNGASAKKRIEDAQRKANSRAAEKASAKCPKKSGQKADKSGQSAELEKRREEKSIPLTNVSGGAKKKTSKAGRREKFDPLAVAFPVALCVPEFTDAWGRWVEFRKSIRKPLAAGSVSTQLAKLAAAGVRASVWAIDHSIGNGYQGLFPEKAPGAGRGGNSGGDLMAGLREFAEAPE